MEYGKEKPQDPQGSIERQTKNNAHLPEGDKEDDSKGTGIIPAEEIIESDADKDRSGNQSGIKGNNNSFLDGHENKDKKCKRNPWNSITFDTDDFFGTLAPA